MKNLSILLLVLTGACSSYGNNPAADFADIKIEEGYYEKMQAESCKVNVKFCSPYVVSYQAGIAPKIVQNGCMGIVNSIDRTALAQTSWKQVSVQRRAEILRKWHDLILQNKAELAQIMHAECFKLLPECEAEIDYAASFVAWYAEAVLSFHFEQSSSQQANAKILCQPIGVVAAITPWNFPAAMITRKVAPALAVGCAVVCKPAEQTPQTAIFLQKLAVEAGLPEGVFEVVSGNPQEIGDAFAKHPKIRKLSFTGSTAVGKMLAAKFAAQMKKVTMELGGNAPFIVCADANLDLAVDLAIKSRLRFSGQACTCANRLLLAEEIAAEFVIKLGNAMQNLEIAPLINFKAKAKNLALLDDALAKGAEIVVPTNFAPARYEGTYLPPVLLTGVRPEMQIFAAEIFGPVFSLMSFATLEQAIELANATEYGLAAYVLSGNRRQAQKIAEVLEFGMVGINELAINKPNLPFGGIKESGIGREGAEFGLEEFCEIKSIVG